MTPGRQRRELDEDDVRVRPSRGTRRRTSTRPAYSDAVDGFVVAVDRGRYTCLVGDTEVVAVRGGDVRKLPVVVGDRVELVGDTSGRVDTLSRIVRIQKRSSVLRRTPDDTDPVERPVVANADLLVIVVALANPEPRLRMIDRCLVAAYDGGLSPVLILTKGDLAPAGPIQEIYDPLDLPVIVAGRGDGGAGLDRLRTEVTGRISVAFGHSGVGKSTLVNALVPGTDRQVGVVNTVTGRGRHTSSSAVAVALPGGGFIIDTPGVRSFGLGAVTPARVLAAFPDLSLAAQDCPRGCDHGADSEDCALLAAAADGRINPARLASFRRLMAARMEDDGAD